MFSEVSDSITNLVQGHKELEVFPLEVMRIHINLLKSVFAEEGVNPLTRSIVTNNVHQIVNAGGNVRLVEGKSAVQMPDGCPLGIFLVNGEQVSMLDAPNMALQVNPAPSSVRPAVQMHNVLTVIQVDVLESQQNVLCSDLSDFITDWQVLGRLLLLDSLHFP